MDAVTYPAAEVVKFVNNYLTPLRFDVSSNAVHEKHTHIWTPTLAVLNLQGDEIQKTIGFFDPYELIACLHLGIAKVHMDAEEYDTAEVHLKDLLQNFQDSRMIPEAIYFNGVNLYKWKDDPGHLKAAYEKLLEEHPHSIWAGRARPYRLI
jgi:hypothetical protein